MDKLIVYADFDWLDSPRIVGELTRQSLRGSETFGFQFHSHWLRDFGKIFLSNDLTSFPGIQYSPAGKQLFGCFADALPDRWGRTLLARRELLSAADEGRAPRRLTQFDYLIGIDDFSRIGAFRFKQSESGPFINSDEALRIPPITNLRTLMEAVKEVEDSDARNVLPQEKWLNQLIRPGSSLGGARPKANVIGHDGHIYIAKFPSRNDDYDCALWEHICHCLAAIAGIKVAQTQLIENTAGHHTLLSRRFDRTPEGKRVHFASALTMLGLSDGDGADTGHGYVDMVDFLIQYCSDADKCLQELYRRVAFNICVGNTDDHFRNHGFLLTKAGWELSPAYDMNPTLDRFQSLLINSATNESSLDVLLNSCEEYLLPRPTAESIIRQVVQAVANWPAVARRLGAPSAETRQFASRFITAL